MMNGMTDRCWRFFTNESDKKTFERRNEKFVKLGEWFQSHPKLQQLYKWEIRDRFKKILFESIDGEYNMPVDGIPSMGKLYKFESMLKKHLKKTDKKSIGFEHWYTGQDRFRHQKELLTFHERMKQRTNTQKVTLTEWTNDGNIMYALARASGEELGYLKKYGFLEKGYNWLASEIPGIETKAIKTLNTMQERYWKILDPKYPKEHFKGEKGLVAAEEYRNQGDTGIKEDSLEYFLKEGEGIVFGLVGDYLAMSKNDFNRAINSQNKHKLRDTQKKALAIADIWRNEKTGLGKKIQNSYINSIESYINSLKRIEGNAGQFVRYSEAVSHAEGLLKYFKKDVERDGLMFLMSFDVLPTLSESMPSILFPESSSGGIFGRGGKTREESFNEGVDLLSTLVETLDSNLKISKDYWSQRDPSLKATIDYNIFPMLDTYVKSAAEFEHYTGLTVDMIDAINWSLNTTSRGDGKLNKAIEFFMKDLQAEYFVESGQKMRENSLLNKFVALATTYEYANKIGFTMSSIAAQTNQGLIGFLYIGKDAMVRRSEVKNHDKELFDKVANGARKVGISFMDVTEVSSNTNFIKKRDPNTGLYRYDIDSSWGDSINTWMQSYARTSGKGFEWVENNFNRQILFELGFIKAWDADRINRPFIKRNFDYSLKQQGRNIQEMKDNTGIKDPDNIAKGKKFSEYDMEFELHLRRRATNLGQEMVKFIHYDYHKIEKSPLFRGDHWLLGELGSTIGQFTHYPQKHWTMMKRILESASGDIVNGEIVTPGTITAAKISMWSIFIEGFFGNFTNTDVSNAVENETFKRLRKWYYGIHHLYNQANNEYDAKVAKVIKKEYFGKGFLRTLLGPFFDSLFTYGMYFAVNDNIRRNPAFTQIFGDNFNDKYFQSKSTGERVTDVFNRSTSKYLFRSIPRARSSANPISTFFKDGLGWYKSRGQQLDTAQFRAKYLGDPPVMPKQKTGGNQSVINVLEEMSKGY